MVLGSNLFPPLFWQELVEMVKAKKAAQEQVAPKSKKWQEPQKTIVSVLF